MPHLVRPTLLMLALLLFAAGPVRAQEPGARDTAEASSPEKLQQMRAMMPMMNDIMRNVMRSTMAALADPETAENLARFTRNYYTALVAQGFTEDQALRIVASLGFPALPGL